jgi:hypothetical protein
MLLLAAIVFVTEHWRFVLWALAPVFYGCKAEVGLPGTETDAAVQT